MFSEMVLETTQKQQPTTVMFSFLDKKAVNKLLSLIWALVLTRNLTNPSLCAPPTESRSFKGIRQPCIYAMGELFFQIHFCCNE